MPIIMRKYIFITTFIVIALQSTVANASDFFTIDESKLKAEMENLSELESLINLQGYTRSELFDQNNELAINTLHPSYSAVNVAYYDDGPPLGIPSFWWGFCFGGIGILLVYLVTENQFETRKALNGCIAMGAIYAVFTVIYVIVIMSTLNDLP